MNDRRTTQGVFHVAEGGLPIPADKIAVPLVAYAQTAARGASRPRRSCCGCRSRANWDRAGARRWSRCCCGRWSARRCPKVSPEKRMEVRFFAPGGLVSNLDFVESIFGNAGDPFLPENDAGLDVDHWTGHSGCVILAPHLTRLRKKDLGLPHVSQATERSGSGHVLGGGDELYNDGRPFKITARDLDGVMVTIIADNYFGYCKKEVKTQIGFSANLFGLAEEEHAGGALAFPTFSLGDRFAPDQARVLTADHRFAEVVSCSATASTSHPSGYATDALYPDDPLPARGHGDRPQAPGHHAGSSDGERAAPQAPARPRLLPSERLQGAHGEAPGRAELAPGGHGPRGHLLPQALHRLGRRQVGDQQEPGRRRALRADLREEASTRTWTLVDGDLQAGLPTTLPDSQPATAAPARPLLSPERSLGSVIKLLTPNPPTSRRSTTPGSRASPTTSARWSSSSSASTGRSGATTGATHFSVDIINGAPGHELKYDGRKLVGSYLRVGLRRARRLAHLQAAAGLRRRRQGADGRRHHRLGRGPGAPRWSASPGVRRAPEPQAGAELRVPPVPAARRRHPPRARQADRDGHGRAPGSSAPTSSRSTRATCSDIVEDVAIHDAFTQPMREHVDRNAARERAASRSARREPRIVDGKPTKNPRYLQVRPDVARPRDRYVAEMGARLYRRLPLRRSRCIFPVISVLSGRRNNPPDRRACGRSASTARSTTRSCPSSSWTTSARSPASRRARPAPDREGALTKGPFNALCRHRRPEQRAGLDAPHRATPASARPPASSARTTASTTTSACSSPRSGAGSSRTSATREHLIEAGHLERLDGLRVRRASRCSRAGSATGSPASSCTRFFGRVFDNPAAVFTEEILKPEMQDPAVFADGVNNIVEAQKRVAPTYFEDGSIEDAARRSARCSTSWPTATWRERTRATPRSARSSPASRCSTSDWYAERLTVKQRRDVELWQRHVRNLTEFLARPGHREEAARLGIPRAAGACAFRAGAGAVARVRAVARRHDRRGPVASAPSLRSG